MIDSCSQPACGVLRREACGLRIYIIGRMTDGKSGVIVDTDEEKSGRNESGKGKIMAAVYFAAYASANYLKSEQYETLYSKEKEQSLIKVRSCKVRKRRKTA